MEKTRIWLVEQYHMLNGDTNGIWHNDGALFAVDSEERAIKDKIRLQKLANKRNETFLKFKYEYREITLF